MTKEEAIKYLQQIYPNGGYCWLDNQRIEAIGMAIQALQEELVSYIPKEGLVSWLKKQFKVSEKVMVRAERDWDRAYNNGEMTAYNNVINKIEQYDGQSKNIGRD